MPRRKYSDREKASALAALDLNEGNVSGTSKRLKIPRVTLMAWANDRHLSEAVPELRQEKKEELSVLFETLARVYIGRALDSEAIADTRGKDAVIAAATATDKVQLLQGKPTSIHSIEDLREKTAKAAEALGIPPEELESLLPIDGTEHVS